MKHRIHASLLIGALLLGCSVDAAAKVGTTKSRKSKRAKAESAASGQWDRREDISVAMLPFTVESKGKAEGAPVLRRELYARLSDLPGFQMVEPAAVDFILTEAGLSAGDEAWRETPPAQLGEILGVDAVLYGKVTEWGKTYLLVQTNITARGEVRLVRCRDGELLWQTKQKAQLGKGLTGIPTGIGGLAFSTLSTLVKKDALYQLAAQLSHTMVETLQPGSGANPPSLKEIDARPGRGGGLNLSLSATPGCRITYEIAPGLSGLPCSEIEPGVYAASYRPIKGAAVQPRGFVVRLRDTAGFAVEKSYAWDGGRLKEIE